MSTRRRAREVAMQALYAYDQSPATGLDETRDFLARRLRFPELEAFALGLVQGVREHAKEIDDAITQSAENWTLSRMAPVDRNVLRIATYELRFTDTPTKAIINEALEVCKRYSTAESVAFVNGVLDRIAHELHRIDAE